MSLSKSTKGTHILSNIGFILMNIGISGIILTGIFTNLLSDFLFNLSIIGYIICFLGELRMSIIDQNLKNKDIVDKILFSLVMPIKMYISVYKKYLYPL